MDKYTSGKVSDIDFTQNELLRAQKFARFRGLRWVKLAPRLLDNRRSTVIRDVASARQSGRSKLIWLKNENGSRRM